MSDRTPPSLQWETPEILEAADTTSLVIASGYTVKTDAHAGQCPTTTKRNSYGSCVPGC